MGVFLRIYECVCKYKNYSNYYIQLISYAKWGICIYIYVMQTMEVLDYALTSNGRRQSTMSNQWALSESKEWFNLRMRLL